MKAFRRMFWGLLVLCAVACDGYIGGTGIDRDAAGRGDSGGDPRVVDPSACTLEDVQQVLTANTCTNCHNESPGVAGAGLDLVSPGLAERIANRRSTNLSCTGDVIVNLEQPEASLLLRSVHPERYAEFGSDECEPARMPLGARAVVSERDVDCLESWIRSLEPGVVVDPDPPVAGDAFTVASRV
ncbi:MAG: hypothetical protein AAGE52_06505, partial [Myxococcota bacterium]